MGICCLANEKYEHCEDKKSLLEVMESELVKYKEELENENHCVIINIYRCFLKDYEELLSEIKGRKLSNIQRIRNLLNQLTNYFENYKKLDDEYKRLFNTLRDTLYTQKKIKLNIP